MNTIMQTTPTTFLKTWLKKKSSSLHPPQGVDYFSLDVVDMDVCEQMKVLITYMCRHPRQIVEEIEKGGIPGFEKLFRTILQKRLGPQIDINKVKPKDEMVWRGTVGEILATGYIIELTDFIVPVLKLRTAHNESKPLLGDDILGFKFKGEAIPHTLLVCEAKFNTRYIKKEIGKAHHKLTQFNKYGPTLMAFIVHELYQTNPSLAKAIQRFYDEYTYKSATKYLIFGVTDLTHFREEGFTEVKDNSLRPLDVAIMKVPNLDTFIARISGDIKSLNLNYPPPSYDVDIIADADKLIGNKDFLIDTKKLASAALTINLQIEGRDLSSYKLEPQKIMNAAHFLSSIALNNDIEQAKKQDLLLRAARLYENLYIWYLKNGNIDFAVNSAMFSAVTYAVGGYVANGHVLIEKIKLLKGISGPSTTGGIWNLGMNALRGSVHELEQEVLKVLYSDSLENVNLETINEIAYGQKICDTFQDVADKTMAKAFACFSDFIRRGVNSKDQFRNYVKQAIIAYRSIGDYSSYHFAALLSEYAKWIYDNSPWTLLTPVLGERLDNDWKVYISSFRMGRFPMVTFWPSQKDCVTKGLLGDENLLITMPTSAGKTRTVEIAIYDALSTDTNVKCAYIVPTRALAVEVEDSLSNRLGRMGIDVSVLYGGYDTSKVDESVIPEARVFVLTMEKFDLLSRQTPAFLESISLLIIDEAHEMASPSLRSLRAELILARILRIAQKKKIRFILLSAVIKNPDDFKNWITGSKIASNWTPTSTRYGYFDWFSGSAQIQYFDEIENKYSEFVPLKFKQAELIDRDPFRLEVAARLGLFFANTGNTLIFVTMKDHITKENGNGVIDHILRLLGNKKLRLNINEAGVDLRSTLAQECASVIGHEHKLVRLIKKGVCYHHGGLPKEVRRIIERGIREGYLPLVVSTTTLTKGVNLPLRNCIVQSLGFPNKISVTEFENAVGRAGRAGFETEGHIIFCHGKDLNYVADNQNIDYSISFIASGIKEAVKLRLPSVTANEMDEIEKWALASTKTFRAKNNENKDKEWKPRPKTLQYQEEILAIIDSQLLAYAVQEAIEELDEIAVENLFRKTLCHVQSIGIEDEVKKLKVNLRNRFLSIKEQIPDESSRQIFTNTGLGIKGNKQISIFADKLIPTLPELKKLEIPPEEFWTNLFDALKDIPEFGNLNEIEAGFLIKWINGADYPSLAGEFCAHDIEATVKHIEDAIYGIPWGITALLLHLKSKANEQEIPIWLGNLSSFVIHGVPNNVAIFIIVGGVNDRICAIQLAKRYLQLGYSTTYGSVKNWLFSLKEEDIRSYVNGISEDIITRIVKRIQEKKNQTIKEDQTIKFESTIENRDYLQGVNLMKVIAHNSEYWIVDVNYNRICLVDKTTSEAIRGLDIRYKDISIKHIQSKDLSVEVELLIR